MTTFAETFLSITDKADGNLNAGIGTGDTSFSLQAGQGADFPASNFCIVVDTEKMLVGSRSGDALSSVTRGYDGSTAATHATAAPVVLPWLSTTYNRMVSNLQGHIHPQSEVTNLTSDLAGKAAASHSHAAADITSGTIATARLGSGTADSTTFLRGDQTYAAPSGGSDPWTFVKITSDFTTSSATAVDVTGMSFTPAANTKYEIEGKFILRTATTTVGPRTGCAWPTGLTDGVVGLRVVSATNAQVLQFGNSNAAVLAPVGGLPSTTLSYLGTIEGYLLAGASPSGTFKIQLASETAGTNVTMKAQSFFRYRTVA